MEKHQSPPPNCDRNRARLGVARKESRPWYPTALASSSFLRRQAALADQTTPVGGWGDYRCVRSRMLSWKQRPQDNGVGDAGADLPIDGQGQGLHGLNVAEEDQVVGGWKILQDYPYLQPEDIRACLEYAAQEVDHPVLVVSGQ